MSESDPGAKPDQDEVLATTLPGGPFDGWYCQNHPPGEAIANARHRAQCWACGEERPSNALRALS